MKNYCLYYQAQVERRRCWFLVAILRSFEHMCFDRTVDKQNSIFEFFVPADMQSTFLSVMRYFENEGIVSNLTEKPNRLAP